jgi:hypothetical protein
MDTVAFDRGSSEVMADARVALTGYFEAVLMIALL